MSSVVSYYKQFTIEEKFGFNKMTKRLFIEDTIKEFLITLVAMSILGLLLNGIINYFKERFLLYTWVLLTLFVLTFLFIFPTFIMPLFNKFENLDLDDPKEKEIHEKIEQLVRDLKFPL